MNISEIDSELLAIDNTIQLYYSWFCNQYNVILKFNQTFHGLGCNPYTESNLTNATSCQLVPYAQCTGANLSGMNLIKSGLNWN